MIQYDINSNQRQKYEIKFHQIMENEISKGPTLIGERNIQDEQEREELKNLNQNRLRKVKKGLKIHDQIFLKSSFLLM
jgi:hypothetical protein